eukprot:1513696-Pyramimonas_sp.AAC.1
MLPASEAKPIQVGHDAIYTVPKYSSCGRADLKYSSCGRAVQKLLGFFAFAPRLNYGTCALAAGQRGKQVSSHCHPERAL